MNTESLRDYCLSFRYVTEETPFGPETLVFKVGGKIFLLLPLDGDGLSFNVKCIPERAVELREKYPAVVKPGYHMNKKHWNTVEAGGHVPDALIREWVRDSYDLVFNNLPGKMKENLK